MPAKDGPVPRLVAGLTLVLAGCATGHGGPAPVEGPVPSFGAGAEVTRWETTAEVPVGLSTPNPNPPVADEAPLADTRSPGAPSDLQNRSRAPSFGAGAEVVEEDRGRGLPWLRRDRDEPEAGAEPSPALAAPRDGYLAEGTDLSPAPGRQAVVDERGAANRPPRPPPAGADELTRRVYRLQTEVYGIKVLLAGQRLASHLLARIEAAQATSAALVSACQGLSGLEVPARRVGDQLGALHAAAESHDPVEMSRMVAEIEVQLGRMRTVIAP